MRDKADKRLWTLSIVGCVIVVLTVLFVSVKIETNNTKKRIHSTMEYIKDQYSMYNSFNEAVEARSLVRMVEKVQQTARNFKTDKQALEKEYKSAIENKELCKGAYFTGSFPTGNLSLASDVVLIIYDLGWEMVQPGVYKVKVN